MAQSAHSPASFDSIGSVAELKYRSHSLDTSATIFGIIAVSAITLTVAFPSRPLLLIDTAVTVPAAAARRRRRLRLHPIVVVI